MPDQEIEKYTHDVSGLVELCRRVVDRIAVIGKDRTVEKQFKAVEASVRQLERQGIAVPEALRGEKVRLGAALAGSRQADYRETLATFATALEATATDIRKRYGLVSGTPKKRRSEKRKPRHRDAGMLRTPNAKLRELMIAVLRDRGGSASPKDVVEGIARRVNGKWFPGDVLLRKDGRTIVWQNNVHWEAARMKQDGALKKDAAKGIWTLSENEVKQ